MGDVAEIFGADVSGFLQFVLEIFKSGWRRQQTMGWEVPEHSLYFSFCLFLMIGNCEIKRWWKLIEPQEGKQGKRSRRPTQLVIFRFPSLSGAEFVPPSLASHTLEVLPKLIRPENPISALFPGASICLLGLPPQPAGLCEVSPDAVLAAMATEGQPLKEEECGEPLTFKISRFFGVGVGREGRE